MNRRKKGLFARPKGGQGSRNRNNKRRAGPPQKPTPPRRMRFRRVGKPYTPNINTRKMLGTHSQITLIEDYFTEITHDACLYLNNRSLRVSLVPQIRGQLTQLRELIDGMKEDREHYQERCRALTSRIAELDDWDQNISAFEQISRYILSRENDTPVNPTYERRSGRYHHFI